MMRRIIRGIPAAFLFFLSYASTGQVVSPVAELPQGIVDGINYTSDTSVTLCLLAPFKEYVYVIGDFNDWEVREDYLMNKTPDGERYWIEIGNLIPGQEYRFQYFVDGEIRVGDPYADKFIDNWTDPDIPEAVYPDLIGYPVGKTEYPVSVFQTAHAPYPWEVEDFVPPAKEKMFIYEMCIRDFVETHSYKTVTDTLEYLQELGVNVLELMPITDFEGNLSWGYNGFVYINGRKYP